MNMKTGIVRLGPAAGPRNDRAGGFNLIEMSLAMTIVLTILLGVMASISTASLAEMNSSEALSSQLLLSQAIEELKDNTFSELPSFNGQYVVSGTNRANISVTALTVDLARIQVNVSSTAFPDVSSSAVLLVANTED